MRNNFFLTSPHVVETSEFPEYVRLLQYNSETNSSITLGTRINLGEYDNAGAASADFLFDYKYGPTNDGSGSLLKYFNILYRVSGDIDTLRSRESFFKDFIIIECSDFSHQSLSAFYRDFVPMVFYQGRKIWQKHIGTLRHSSSKRAFILINPSNNIFTVDSSTTTLDENDFEVRICPKMGTNVQSSWNKLKLELESLTPDISSLDTNYTSFKVTTDLTFLQKDSINDYDVYYAEQPEDPTEEPYIFYRMPNSIYFFSVQQEYATVESEDDTDSSSGSIETFELIARQADHNPESLETTYPYDYYEAYALNTSSSLGSDDGIEYIAKADVILTLTFRTTDAFIRNEVSDNKYLFYLFSKQVEADAAYYSGNLSFEKLIGKSLATKFSPVDSISYFDFYDSNGLKITDFGSYLSNDDGLVPGIINISSTDNLMLLFKKYMSINTLATTNTEFEVIPNYTSTRKLEYNVLNDADSEENTITFSQLRYLNYIYPYNLRNEEYLIFENGKLKTANEINDSSDGSITVSEDSIYTVVLYDNGDIDTSIVDGDFSEFNTELSVYPSFANKLDPDSKNDSDDIREHFKRQFWSTFRDPESSPLPEVATDPYLNTEDNSLYDEDHIYTGVYPYELNERADGSLLRLKDSEPTFENFEKTNYASIKFNGEFEIGDEEVDDAIDAFMAMPIFNTEIKNPILTSELVNENEESSVYSNLTSYIVNVDSQYENLETNLTWIIDESERNGIQFNVVATVDIPGTPIGTPINSITFTKAYSDKTLLICKLSDYDTTGSDTYIYYTQTSTLRIEPDYVECRIIPPEKKYFLLFLNTEMLTEGEEGILSFYYKKDSKRLITTVLEYNTVTKTAEEEGG